MLTDVSVTLSIENSPQFPNMGGLDFCPVAVIATSNITKRIFDVNLFTKKFYWVEQDMWISLKISAAGLRTINKIGLDAAIKKAAEKGYLYA